MKVKSIAECSPWSILQYFWPALSNKWFWKPIFGLFESGRFTQVLLYSIPGPLTEVSLPIDSLTKKLKGFAFVTYMIPEHAVKAFSELDGIIFQVGASLTLCMFLLLSAEFYQNKLVKIILKIQIRTDILCWFWSGSKLFKVQNNLFPWTRYFICCLLLVQPGRPVLAWLKNCWLWHNELKKKQKTELYNWQKWSLNDHLQK